ncbi:V-type ATP synthase subunit A [Demequina zhanjiangensis]|uniref:V-type ATP synthase subunit A n=1 Tax=Demequina zhanjiangensis TaxID=3051659 RepID=A0ABT8FYG8_9MICO|nr:V-type ATP synthase subunit A [Demequina sp. SYSU T00b26]MDN4471938.1 V-type ATP synthase subunit A [Demequina sp. SYSU T00b26]
MTDATASGQARTVRVTGPLLEADGVPDVAMGEILHVGPDRISAEVVAVQGGRATLQAYEYTGGIRAGEHAAPSGRPLTGLFGPGLLGSAFDGLMRPLTSAPVWLSPDRPLHTAEGADARRWHFEPRVVTGDEVSEGDVLGVVPDSGAVEHRVMVPAGTHGRVEWIAEAGETGALDRVATVAGTDVHLSDHWPIRRPRPFRERLSDPVPLHTGQRVLDLFFPVARGAAAAVSGGFGTGKTMLLQQIAKWCDADVIVYVGCGERGNEMADVLDDFAQLADERTGGRLVDRTVVVANTSNMPMMARELSIYTGISIAEFYRDMGHDAVVIADSTSRWAEALREFANRRGDLPAEEGFPADLSSQLAAFYERAGRVTTLGGQDASVTVIGAVSPPGGDMSEPVTTITQRFVRAMWMLDRDLAYARHYPAVQWSGSFARDTAGLARWQTVRGDPEWSVRRATALEVLAEADRLASLAEVIGVNSLPSRERMVVLGGRLLREAVLAQNALHPHDATCSDEKGAALLDTVLEVIDACHAAIDRGATATAVERLDFGPVIRAAQAAGRDDSATIATIREQALDELGRLP